MSRCLGRRTVAVAGLLTGTHLLAGCGAGEGGPASWSPETAPLVLGATRDGRTDLYVHDPRTGRTTAVVWTERVEVGPVPSPDGRRLAYHARTETEPYHLYLADLEEGRASPDGGSETVRITPLRSEEGTHFIGAVWSPEGREVAYFSNRGLRPGPDGPFPGHVYAVEVETGRERRLTRTPLEGTLGPSDWSADGRFILMSRRFEGHLDLVRLDVETGAEERITRDPNDEYSARWSHDGSRIAFHVEDGSGARVVVLDLATGERRRVTREEGWWYAPSWSPDDAWLLISAAGRDGVDYDVVAVRVEDGHVVRLVDTPEDERYAAWIDGESPWALRGEVR